MLGALSPHASFRGRALGRDPGRGRGRGFTLIELLVTFAIAAVIVSLAAPSLYTMIQRKRVVAAAEDLRSDLREAQRMALGIAPDMAVHFTHDASSSCYVVYMQRGLPGLSECSCRTTPMCNGPDSESVKVASQGAGGGIRLVAMDAGTAQPDAIVVFRRQVGTLKPGLGYSTELAVMVEGAGGGQLKLTVQPSGRTLVCSVGGQHAGYPTCA